MKNSLQKIRVGAYRLVVFAALVAALVYGSRSSKRPSWDSEQVLALAQEVLPAGEGIGELKDGSAELLDSDGELVGHVTMTSPESDSVTGYAGPTNLLVLFDPAWDVVGMRVISSADTWSHLRKVEKDEGFWKQWLGYPESDLPSKVAVVSGATLTSEAIAKGVRARFSGEQAAGHYMDEPTMEVVKEVFPKGNQLISVNGREETYRVISIEEELLGVLLRSGNQGGQPRGFNGTSDVWVFLDAKGETVKHVRLFGSRDNEPYLSDVREELKWTEEFADVSVAELLGDKRTSDQVMVVSGATVTSNAMTETVRKLLRDYQRPLVVKSWWQGRDSILACWVVLAVLLGYSRWKGAKWLRWVTEGAAILVGGVWLGVMVGMGSLVGWSRGELPWASFPGLVLLGTVALLIPVATGKNTYCAKLCAHGAAQGMLFRLIKWRWVPKARWHKRLKWIPMLTLVAVFVLAATGLRFDFSSLEPFDVWSVGWFAIVPVVIFVIGLVASLFIPKAYCKYGCPTGFLFDQFAASRSRLRKRDWLAGGLAILCWVVVLAMRGLS